MPASILASLAGTAASNATSEWHAGKQFNREKQLMNMQNDMNNANALNAYSQQVQGLKMAGLSPALLNGQTPQMAPAVTKGNASQAENVEIDPTIGLLKAQKDNIEADTAKKQAEVGNVEADTSKKTAETLYTNAGTDKVKEETQNIKNINTTYKDTNAQLNPMGQAMAQKWQGMEWYNKLAPETKDWIDSVASGNEKLTVGGMDALHKIIQSQKDISDADRTLVKNSFDNAISEAMYNDPEIMEAISKAPLNEQNKIKEEINKLIADTTFTKKNTKDLENRIQSFINSDLGFLASKGKWGAWTRELLVQKLAAPLATGLAGGGILGLINRFLPKGKKGKTDWMDNVDTSGWSGKATRERPNYGKSYQQMKNEGLLGGNNNGMGVQSMKK